MSDLTELIENLREFHWEFSDWSDLKKAADAIEAQEARIAELEEIIRGKDDVLYEKRECINQLRENLSALTPSLPK